MYKFLLIIFLSTILSFVSAEANTPLSSPVSATGKDSKPWVTRELVPYRITQGLYGHHLTVWPSHGRYYNKTKDAWVWQRPNLYCTNEDLFTQTIVIPYLIPMLENAGANVFVPRERDWQTEEVIVNRPGAFKTTPKGGSMQYWKPSLKKNGLYAVYVRYQMMDNSADDAQYIVRHKGMNTYFRVNQRMGGNVWVYLGTFDFASNNPLDNCVMMTNCGSKRNSVVNTQMVRFGGGMGTIQRNGQKSGLPKSMEGSRYWAEMNCIPEEIYTSKGDDYSDDINTRTLFSNWLSYGSTFNPHEDKEEVPDSLKQDSIQPTATPLQAINVTEPSPYTGHVPIEMTLALHSDAGWAKDLQSIIGSLTICTTNFKDSTLADGRSRLLSKQLASTLLRNVAEELRNTYGKWEAREVYDRNYGETRIPAQPSAIIETMSHENFPDMVLGQDPNFKFSMARAIYKVIARFLAEQKGHKVTIQPLQPHAFAAKTLDEDKLTLTWLPTEDPYEQSANATSYCLYTSMDNNGYDNGTQISKNRTTIELKPNVLYRFKVTAVNAGGESFPTEELAAYYNPDAKENILIVNGFHRLSSPEVVQNDTLQGFDLDADIGLSYGKTPAWVGHQTVFEKNKAGKSLGLTNNDLIGRFFAGNDFNYVSTHAEAIAAEKRFNIVSMSSELLNDEIDLSPYQAIDYILGNEKNDGHSLKSYKTLNISQQRCLTAYTIMGGKLLISGSYIASDMTETNDSLFLANTLHLRYAGTDRVNQPFGEDYASDNIRGFNTEASVFRHINADHYASVSSDVIQPILDGSRQNTSAMLYQSGLSAAVAYVDENTRTFAMGFPFECIKYPSQRNKLMSGILNFLLPTEQNK